MPRRAGTSAIAPRFLVCSVRRPESWVTLWASRSALMYVAVAASSFTGIINTIVFAVTIVFTVGAATRLRLKSGGGWREGWV